MILFTAIIWLTVQQRCQVQGANTVGLRNNHGFIRPIPCSQKTSGEKGVCMFSWQCFKQKGVHLGTCVDRFYIGSCCKLPNKVSSSIINIQTITSTIPNPNIIPTNDHTLTTSSPTVPIVKNETFNLTTPSHFATSIFATTPKTSSWSDSKVSSDPPNILFWTRDSSVNLIINKNKTSSEDGETTLSFKPPEETSHVIFTTSRKPFVTRSTTQKSTTMSQSKDSLKWKPFPSYRPSTDGNIKVSFTSGTSIKDTLTVSNSETTTQTSTLNYSTDSTNESSTYSSVFNDSSILPLASVTNPTEFSISPETTSEFQNIFNELHFPIVNVHIINTTEFSGTTKSPEITSEFQEVFIEPVFPSMNFSYTNTTEYPDTTTEFQDVTIKVNTIKYTTSSETTSEFPEVFIEPVFPIINFDLPNTVEGFSFTEIPETTSKSQQVFTELNRPMVTVPSKPSISTESLETSTSLKLSISTDSTETTSNKFPQVFIEPELPIVEWLPPITIPLPDKFTQTIRPSMTTSENEVGTEMSTQHTLENQTQEVTTNTQTSSATTEELTTSFLPTQQLEITGSLTTGHTELTTGFDNFTDEAVSTMHYSQLCGRQFHPMYPSGRIVGGMKAEFAEWPWQVSLRQWKRGMFMHKCGAALLNDNWAITAAHCVESVAPADLLLRMGEYEVTSENEPLGFAEREVQLIVPHPNFNPKNFENDLALLRFYDPLRFQKNIIPICLPTDNSSFLHHTAYVTGWGRLFADGPLPPVMQEVSVPIITNIDCQLMYKKAGFRENIPDIFICAGAATGGKDSCEGDSGGPLVIQRPDRRWLLAGIISWGIGCAEPNQPGVYTRISAFRDWINTFIEI